MFLPNVVQFDALDSAKKAGKGSPEKWAETNR